MKKLFILMFSIFISLNTYADWAFHSSSLEGDTFHIHSNSIKKDNGYVYFWYLKSYLMPNKFGDFSSKVYVQGDCTNNRLKYLTYVWYKQPMGKGLGERSDEQSEWESPVSESVGIDLLYKVCSS